VNRTVINEDIMNLSVVENDGVRGNLKKTGTLRLVLYLYTPS
jgi:hypothetical protein